MAKNQMIAMILAGGQGSRLGVLTKNLAKPAVPFGSRYRIVDFTLSNCSNSGIETVGVLTQYQPLDLNTYIGNGQPWDLDRIYGGAYILPPYQKSSGSDWYKGTANAIYQNTRFIDNYDPTYVLILSGDHIYKMNYAAMLKAHIDAGADATIAVIEVPWAEASRFGIMNTDISGVVTEFDEKPKKPKSNLASMGVYIFTWSMLKKKLAEDEAMSSSSHDFGKDIIPDMLDKGMKLLAHRFSGYWKDVGTIESLWEANMDLLDRPEDINLIDSSWRIYSRNPVKPAHFIAKGAVVHSSCLTDGCVVEGTVEHSVLFNSVLVEKGALVKNSILMPGCIVRSGAYVNKTIVGAGTVIGHNAKIGYTCLGSSPYLNTHICTNDISVVESGVIIKDGVEIPCNCMIEIDDTIPQSQSVIAGLSSVKGV
ncbi:MAG: glucose-1-phosphate adenylyltransferase [Saccharofermentanales bacterium]